MAATPLLKKIERIITPAADSMGYEIVRLLMVGVGSGKSTLQVMAEKPDGTMDVEDVFDEAYYLEVSSPGIDRPLTRAKDFDRYKGFDARIEMEDPIDGQKKFKGLLKGIDASEVVTLTTDKGDVALPFARIEKAKLLLTDALIEAHQKPRGEKKNTKSKDTPHTPTKKDGKGK